MPLESVTYTSDLVVTNPDHNDSIGAVDSHVRNLKVAIKNTFPSLTGPVTLTQTQINALSTAIARIVALEGASNHLTGDQILTGNLDQSAGHWINTPGGLFENYQRLVPHGVITLWYGPMGSVPGGWALCDGTNGTPDLRDRFVVGAGATYVPGSTGGSDVVSGTSAVGGAHSHNGLTEPAGGHSHVAVSDEQGYHVHTANTMGHALTIDEIPPHNHSFGLHGGPAQSPSSVGDWSTGGGTINVSTNFVGSGWSHTHGIVGDGAHSHNVFVDTKADHAHGIDWDAGHTHTVSFDIRPRYYALQYIMKL